MTDWESDFDRWLTTPPEPDVIGQCDYCECDLYRGCDYVHDRNTDEWFCDDHCYVNKRRDTGDVVTEVPE